MAGKSTLLEAAQEGITTPVSPILGAQAAKPITPEVAGHLCFRIWTEKESRLAGGGCAPSTQIADIDAMGQAKEEET